MAATTVDRVDVHRVSYVVSTCEDGKRTRELREDLYGGRTPAEAAANAERWVREVYQERLDSIEITAVRHIFTMERCRTCRTFRGPEECGYRGDEALVLHIVAERVAEPRADAFEAGHLAALLRLNGYGLRVAARCRPEDAGRLEVHDGDDIALTVAASPNGHGVRVTTPTGKLTLEKGAAARIFRRDLDCLLRDMDGKEVLSIDVPIRTGASSENVLCAIENLMVAAVLLRHPESADSDEEDVPPTLAGKFLPRKPQA